MAGPGSSHQTSSRNWRQIVTSLYPEALTRTYCVPPVHFNRVPYARGTLPGTGHSELVQHPPSGAAPVHNVPPVSQRPVPPSGAAPVHNVPPVSQRPVPPSGAAPVHNVPPVSQRPVPPSGAAPVHNVPPVSQRPVPPSKYSLWTQESQPQALPGRVQESDLRDDFAQNHVMLNLQELGNSRREAMFILSQLNFGNYLNQPAYATAAAQLPRPVHSAPRYRDGDFDFLLIHRQHGILIGELKSVGKNQAAFNKTQAQANADVAKRVTKAVKQLDRSETVVRHLVSDVAPGLTVRKTLVLPYVRTEQLKLALDNDPQLEEAVCRSLGAGNASEAVQLCCCSDQLSQPASYWDVTPAVLSQLSTWWQHRMACTVDTLLSDDKYLDIVARFVGPATTVSVPCYNGARVEVRTAGQAVAELGWGLAPLVLTLQQLDLLHRNPPLVYITGPPGTGKTVVLILQGLQWLLQGQDVHLISTEYTTRAASFMIREQLQLSLTADLTPSLTPGSIFFNQYNFHSSEADLEHAISDLLANVKNGRLYILLDEVSFDSRAVSGARHIKLIEALTRSVPRLHLWAAGIGHTDVPPQLRPEPLTVPLRCAPSVVREIQTAVGRIPGMVHFSDSGVPAPGDGLRVIRQSHHGNAHTCRWPVECTQCGHNIAAELRRLGVGSAAGFSFVAPLSYRDVLIITRSSELHDDIKDDAGQVTSPASGVVRGLRDEGLPVCVLGDQDLRHNMARFERDVHDVAVAAKDRITVTDSSYVKGLERRVVVILPGREEAFDTGVSDEMLDVNDRLFAASRCTTQLIMVDVPPPIALSYNKDDHEGDGNANASYNDRPMQGQTKSRKGDSDPSGVAWVKRKGFLL